MRSNASGRKVVLVWFYLEDDETGDFVSRKSENGIE